MNACEIIRENKARIVESWFDLLVAEFPEVKDFNKTAIENDVPELLDSLAEYLGEIGHPPDFSGSSHGQQRAGLKDYSLLQVIKEYRLLKQAIFLVIDEKKYPIEPAERNKVMYAVDKATESAAVIFTNIVNRGLVESKKKAETSIEVLKGDEKARHEFINAVWHDLNTSLNNIRLSAELLGAEDVPTNLRRFLAIIKTNTEKTLKMVKNLLDINLVTFGHNFPIKKALVNLSRFLQEAYQGFKQDYSTPFVLQLPSDDITALADVNALSRALDNLVGNAVKYGDRTTPIKLQGSRQGHHIIISVGNYGKQIPPEMQIRIFSQFYQEKSSKGMGYGIGLHLVKIVAEAHGGTVSVHSSETEGTVFTLAIPTE